MNIYVHLEIDSVHNIYKFPLRLIKYIYFQEYSKIFLHDYMNISDKIV